MASASQVTFSEATGAFVCPACNPAPSFTPPARNGQRSWLLAAIGLTAAALLVTALAIFFFSRAGGDPILQWEHENHDRLIALKSEAEALAIAGKLPEAHAKYREMEKLLGGRTVKDPQLFDMVDQARADQDRIYTMILRTIDRPRPTASAPAPEPPSAPEPVAAAPASVEPPAAPVPAPSAQAVEPPPSSAPSSAPPATTAAAQAETPPTTRNQAAATEPEPPATGPTTSTAAPREIESSTRLTDAQIGQAIQRGADFLISNFQDGQLTRRPGTSDVESEGINALAVYALLQSGRAINDPRLSIKGPFMQKCLDTLRAAPLDPHGQLQSPLTYAHSLRAAALATYNRPQDHEVLQKDVKWLIAAARDGAYSYDNRFSNPQSRSDTAPPAASESLAQMADARGNDRSSPVFFHGRHGPHGEELDYPPPPPGKPGPPPPPPPPPRPGVPAPINITRTSRIFRNSLAGITPPAKVAPSYPWDNSNSQYGLLGVWAGAEVGIEVPLKYWRAVEKHWTGCQLPSGEWNYDGSDQAGYFSMTVAGIASLLVTHDYLDAPLLARGRAPARDPYSQSLSSGLAWLEDGDNSVRVMDAHYYVGYDLFGIERVGLASGMKHFGAHDWFAELATKILPMQQSDGSFRFNAAGVLGYEGGLNIIDTSYALLFLARGRHPIMMNKLHFDDFWTNRPRDIANLAAFASRDLERPLNWQVVDITHSPDDWSDSPILYIASHEPPKIDDEGLNKIGAFIEKGGLLVTHSDLGAEAFNGFVAKLAKKLFPDYPLEELPATHPIYAVNYNLPTPRPRLLGVSNGSRLLMVHSPTDLSLAWQVRSSASRKEIFQLGVNFYLYATGKERFRNRLDTRAPLLPTAPPSRTIEITRIEYDGDWDPERGAWLHFAPAFENRTGIHLEIKSAKPQELDPAQCHIALLTGIRAAAPGDAALPAVTKFVEQGGTLLVDTCGGSGPFADTSAAWIAKLSPTAKLEPLAEDDKLLKKTIEGTVDAPADKLRLYATEQLGSGANRLKVMNVGKGRVIFSSLDITSGLLDTNTWGILGYLPQYSEALATNLVLTASPN